MKPRYSYDANTLRFAGLMGGSSPDYSDYQNLSYLYDARGNVRYITDTATAGGAQFVGCGYLVPCRLPWTAPSPVPQAGQQSEYLGAVVPHIGRHDACPPGGLQPVLSIEPGDGVRPSIGPYPARRHEARGAKPCTQAHPTNFLTIPRLCLHISHIA